MVMSFLHGIAGQAFWTLFGPTTICDCVHFLRHFLVKSTPSVRAQRSECPVPMVFLSASLRRCREGAVLGLATCEGHIPYTPYRMP